MFVQKIFSLIMLVAIMVLEWSIYKYITTKNVTEDAKATKTRFIGFDEALSNFFKKSFNYKGVATRAEFWWIVLFYEIINVLILLFVKMHPELPQGSLSVYIIWNLFSVIAFIALLVRRMHDIGKSGFVLLGSVLGAGFFMFIGSQIRSLSLLGAIIGFLCSLVGLFCAVVYPFALLTEPSKYNHNKYRGIKNG